MNLLADLSRAIALLNIVGKIGCCLFEGTLETG